MYSEVNVIIQMRKVKWIGSRTWGVSCQSGYDNASTAKITSGKESNCWKAFWLLMVEGRIVGKFLLIEIMKCEQ